jgi:hypothetical protein
MLKAKGKTHGLSGASLKPLHSTDGVSYPPTRRLAIRALAFILVATNATSSGTTVIPRASRLVHQACNAECRNSKPLRCCSATALPSNCRHHHRRRVSRSRCRSSSTHLSGPPIPLASKARWSSSRSMQLLTTFRLATPLSARRDSPLSRAVLRWL